MDTNLEHYLTSFPQYRDPLEFLQNIFDFQAELTQKIDAGQQKFTQTEVIAQADTNQPLFFSQAIVRVDPVLFQEALTRLRPLLTADEAAQMALDRLQAVAVTAQPDFRTLLTAFNAGDEAGVEQLAHNLALAPEPLAFLLQIVLTPFFEKAAQPYQKRPEPAHWRDGHCPVCGREPLIARLAGEAGRRILMCLLCHTEWPFDRLRCPFCEDDTETPKLNYFTVDDDKAHRVDCCDQCHRYLKTVDERLVNYPINLFAENVITAHLDTIANEQGYH